MRLLHLILFLIGLVVLISLIVYLGAGDIAKAVISLQWGLLWVILFHLIPLFFNTMGWSALVSGRSRPRLIQLLQFRWIGESLNNLLPVAQVGGDVMRARLLAQTGVNGSEAGASVLADFTVGLLAQIVFAIVGVSLLFVANVDDGTAQSLLLGLMIAVIPVGAFFALQHFGLFGSSAKVMSRLINAPQWDSVLGNAISLDQAIHHLYTQYQPLAVCALWRLGAWFFGAGETWLALYFLGVPVSFTDALILESLGYAARSAAFLVPGALGVMEGALILVGSLIGITPVTALTLALVKRVREIALGAPGILAWYIVEAAPHRKAEH